MSIEELKNRIKEHPISEIIGAYIQVTKKGPHHTALCPFHDDHNPSLMINNDRASFKCFVDDTGGDAISFVQQYKHINFMESLKDICDKMGWRFEDYDRGGRRHHPKRDLALKVLKKAQLLYRRESQRGQALEYRKFVEERGLTPTTLEDFAIGWAPAGNVLSHYLLSIKDEKKRQEAMGVALEIHLIGRDDKSKAYYDTFRDRIIFPVHGPKGETLGFCGRKTRAFQKAKYMNSRESFVFHKRDILFGLSKAREEMNQHDAAILTEGHMDCIALHQYGLCHSVAMMGLALGERALSRIAAITKNLYLALDNDQAGRAATQRVNSLCMGVGLLPKFIDLSPHKDPDEFLSREGQIAFRERVHGARACVDVLVDGEIPETVPRAVDRQIEILEKIFLLLSPLGISLAATERLGSIAKRLGMTSGPEQIANSYRMFLENRKLGPRNAPPLADETSREGSDPGVAGSDGDDDSPLSPTEMALIREIKLAPKLLTRPKFSDLLDFLGEKARDDILGLRELYCEEGGPTPPDPGVVEVLEKVLDDVLLRFRKDRLMAKKAALRERQREVTLPQEARDILGDLSVVERELLALKSGKGVSSMAKPHDGESHGVH